MSAFLIGIIIVIIVIAILLLLILINISSQNKSSNKSSNTNISAPKNLVVENIMLPKKISQMDDYSLTKAAKQVFESFKALDYASKSPSKLDKIEWHTWQVSLLMAMFKQNKFLFVSNDDSLFHDLILNSNKNLIVQSTQKIIDKYNNHINLNKSRDELSQDIIWSSREVSILFYYMSKY